MRDSDLRHGHESNHSLQTLCSHLRNLRSAKVLSIQRQQQQQLLLCRQAAEAAAAPLQACGSSSTCSFALPSTGNPHRGCLWGILISGPTNVSVLSGNHLASTEHSRKVSHLGCLRGVLDLGGKQLVHEEGREQQAGGGGHDGGLQDQEARAAGSLRGVDPQEVQTAGTIRGSSSTGSMTTVAPA